MQHDFKLKFYGMRECRQEIEVLQRNLLENLKHNNTQKMDRSFKGEISLPFKVIQIVEIKMKMVDDQWLNLKMRGNPCAHTSQPIEYKLTSHIR